MLKQHLSRGGFLRREDCVRIIRQATELFRQEPNVLSLGEPLTVVGDLHGQFYDLLKVLDLGGDFMDNK